MFMFVAYHDLLLPYGLSYPIGSLLQPITILWRKPWGYGAIGAGIGWAGIGRILLQHAVQHAANLLVGVQWLAAALPGNLVIHVQ